MHVCFCCVWYILLVLSREIGWEVVLLRPSNFTATAVVGYRQTNTAIAVFYSVLGGLSGRCFLTSAAPSSDSYLYAASFDCVNAWWVSPVSHTACPPPRIRFPTQRDSRDSLGTVLSETVTMVSLSALPAGACSERLAHSRTTRTIWSASRNIHLFPINNPGLDTDRYPTPAPRWHVRKNTVTDRVANSCHRNNTIGNNSEMTYFVLGGT